MTKRPKRKDFDTEIANFTPRQIQAVKALDSGAIKFLLYGGALGGGKSYLLRWYAARRLIWFYKTYGLKNVTGTVAMARTAEVNSATSQFFINVKDNPFLDNGVRDYGYAVFGMVVDGMETVEKIRNVKTGGEKGKDVPVKTVLIKSIRRIVEEKKEAKEK